MCFRRQPIGRPGQIVCPRCMPEHHKFARSFSRNWRDHHPEPSVFGKPRTQPRCWQHERMEVPDWSQSGRGRVDPVGNFTHLLLATPFATRVHLPPLSTDHQALRASQRGPCASRHFTCLPSSQETTFTSEEFHTLMLVRLHLSIHVDGRVCNAVNLWTCLVTTGQHVHGLGLVGLPQKCAWRESAEKQALASRRIKFFVISMSSFLRTTSAGSRSLRTAFHFGGQAGCHRHHSGFSVDRAGMARGRGKGPGHLRGGTGQVPEMSRVGQREPVPFARDGIRGGRAVDCKSGLVQVPVSPSVLRRSTQLLFFQRWTALLACSIQRAYAATLLGNHWERLAARMGLRCTWVIWTVLSECGVVE